MPWLSLLCGFVSFSLLTPLVWPQRVLFPRDSHEQGCLPGSRGRCWVVPVGGPGCSRGFSAGPGGLKLLRGRGLRGWGLADGPAAPNVDVCLLRKGQGGLRAVRRAAAGHVSWAAWALHAHDSGEVSGRPRPPQAAVGQSGPAGSWATTLLPVEEALPWRPRVPGLSPSLAPGVPCGPLLMGMGGGGPGGTSCAGVDGTAAGPEPWRQIPHAPDLPS